MIDKLLPIIRKNIPSKVSSSILEEQPISKTIEYKTQERLKISGGRIHQFGRGFLLKQYRLTKIQESVPKNLEEIKGSFLVPTKILETIETYPKEVFILPRKIRNQWEKKIKEFGIKDVISKI